VASIFVGKNFERWGQVKLESPEEVEPEVRELVKFAVSQHAQWMQETERSTEDSKPVETQMTIWQTASSQLSEMTQMPLEGQRRAKRFGHGEMVVQTTWIERKQEVDWFD
jgi:hypothetical protein